MATLESGRKSVPLSTYPKHKFSFTEKPFVNALSVKKYQILIKSRQPAQIPPHTPSDIDISLDTNREQKPRHTLYNQFMETAIQTPSTVGLPAIKSFYSKYKQLNKPNPSESDSAVTSSYLKYLSSINHSPQPMGIVKQKGPPNEIILKYINKQ